MEIDFILNESTEECTHCSALESGYYSNDLHTNEPLEGV